MEMSRQLRTHCNKLALSCASRREMVGPFVLCRQPLRTHRKELPPIFLAPLLAFTPKYPAQRNAFSTTLPVNDRKKKRVDGNAHRGESALRRTGPKTFLEMSKMPLPQPVLNPERRSKVETDPDHGLWGFFNRDKQALSTPTADNAHGINMSRPPNWKLAECRTRARLGAPRVAA